MLGRKVNSVSPSRGYKYLRKDSSICFNVLVRVKGDKDYFGMLVILLKELPNGLAGHRCGFFHRITIYASSQCTEGNAVVRAITSDNLQALLVAAPEQALSFSRVTNSSVLRSDGVDDGVGREIVASSDFGFAWVAAAE